MKRVEGHVFQPLMEDLERLLEVPESWTTGSKLMPSIDGEVASLEKQLNTFAERIWRRAKRQGAAAEYRGEHSISWNPAHLRAGWAAEARARKGCITEEQIRSIRTRYRNFVIAPLDKGSGEAVII